MRTLNLSLAITALILSGYLGWRYLQPELNGHWHIIQDDSKINPGISTLDIRWDNVVQADKFQMGGSAIGGPLDRFRRNIFLFPTCLGLELNLSWKGDTLMMTEARFHQEGQAGVLKAVFIPEGECTAEEDHFLSSKHRVTIPKVDLDEITIRYEPNSLGLILPASPESMTFIVVDRLGRRLNAEQLLNEAEMADVKNATGASPTIVSLFANDDVSPARIEAVRKIFSKEGKGRAIYQVKKNFDEYGRLQLFWVEI